MKQDRIMEISLSKSKLTRGLVASIIFVLMGFWLLTYEPTESNPIFNYPFVKYVAAIASILFFGFGTFYFSRKLTDKKPGIVIDDEGITDNSSAVAVGLIPWSDIKQLAKAKVMKQEFIIIVVNNPEYYLSQQTSFLKKKGMKYNYNNYGSPLAISANGLKCNLKELTIILERKLSEYKSKVGPY